MLDGMNDPMAATGDIINDVIHGSTVKASMWDTVDESLWEETFCFVWAEIGDPLWASIEASQRDSVMGDVTRRIQ